MSSHLFIGIDLAWTDKNPSGVAVLSDDPVPRLIEHRLVRTLEEIVELITSYLSDFSVSVGVDAPLKVPNETGNREIEKAFLRDFSRYKIGMLPVNRAVMRRMFGLIRGEMLLELLRAEGFVLGTDTVRSVVEIYPHATIAVCFNHNRLLPYKRKKGRTLADVKSALATYQTYLRQAVSDHPVLDVDVGALRGKALKEYEDMLDGITSAYTLWYCRNYPGECKIYSAEGEGYFVTPFPKN